MATLLRNQIANQTDKLGACFDTIDQLMVLNLLELAAQ
jgi:hypothetical protein